MKILQSNQKLRVIRNKTPLTHFLKHSLLANIGFLPAIGHGGWIVETVGIDGKIYESHEKDNIGFILWDDAEIPIIMRMNYFDFDWYYDYIPPSWL